MCFKIGSLFDGSGGFPLAAAMCGGVPVWASEVEPYPIAVTRSRFPNMIHLGDISKINGAEIAPVDVITFGSPCQDLSVAGKRAGLKHEDNGDDETTRSGLFMEAVRIIKEMRANDKASGRPAHMVRPRFALWENVPGAFSSNGGEDFRTVLQELIKIVEPEAPEVPAPDKNGWPYADCIVGDGWSLAWRTFDAQYWGVPQRRRRIHLVVDFAGECAGEILFEREGVRGYFAEGGTPWEGTAADAQGSSGADDREGIGVMSFVDAHILDDQGGQQIGVRTDGKSPTLRAEMHGNVPCVMQAAGFKAGQGVKAHGIGWEEERAPTLASEAGGNSVPSVCAKVYDVRGNGDGETVPTLTGDHENRVTDYTAVAVEPVCCIDGDKIGKAERAGGSGLGIRPGDKMQDAYQDMFVVGRECESEDEVCVFDKEVYNSGENATGGHYISCGGPAPTLRGTGHAPGVAVRYIVRRLTPTECARLQGFPDEWGHPDHKADFSNEEYRFWMEVRNTHAAINGKAVKEYTKEQMLKWYNGLHTDSAEYKMWGNGIALPPALYCMQGIADVLRKEKSDG